MQRKASAEAAAGGATPESIAQRGTEGSGGRLPHQDRIQALFGRHDISGVTAHEGPAAREASQALGAQAYTHGNAVAFASPPDLHTAAHEAAHVVQQRGGVQLKGGIDQPGDAYERHADAVADAVVAGTSAEPLLDQLAGGGQPASAVQRMPASGGASKASGNAAAGATGSGVAGAASGITPPKPGIHKVGFIDNSQGSFIRTGPRESGGKELLPTPLPPATRVFVSGTHPDTDGWWYVTAYLGEGEHKSMVRGYVQGLRVNTDLPEPMAELHQVGHGETAERLAQRKFGKHVTDGHDLRYYENVLLHVNQQRGRAGVTGSYQDPGLLGGGRNNVQLLEGKRIWLVSPEYAKTLQGMVPSGSLTGGAVAKARRFAAHLEDILRSVTESRNHFREVAGEYAQAIREHLPEIVGIVAGFLMAEAASAFLAATPTGVGQIAAAVIQLGLSAFGAAGMVQAGVEAVKHASEWLTIAWTAKGNDEKIAAASQEFLRMLVAIAAAALSYVGAKGNYGNALKIARSMPAGGVPALAVAGGAHVGGAGAGTGVFIGPWTGSIGAAGNAMMQESKEGSGGKDDAAPQKNAEAKPREERIKELAKDPAHGGAVDEKTLREAEVGVSLEEAGKLPKPITRDPSGAAEFVDGLGQPWDVKRFNSNFPPRKGGYTLKDSLMKIKQELAKGENVIIDTIDLKAAHLAELRAAVTANGWDARVIWY